MTKRIVVVSDFHCGHRAGLTPPEWQANLKRGRYAKWTKIERECWRWYARTLKELRRERPIDLAVFAGDGIEGAGRRSGGTELLVTDRDEQVEMAVRGLQEIGGKKYSLVRGTAYHVGDEEDWEDQIARAFNTTAHDHEWYDVNGIIFDVKHHVGMSQVPYGRHTAIMRDLVWNSLWAEAKQAPRADFLIRAHVHFSVGGWVFNGVNQRWAMTLPALQAMGTKYGARRMSGLVDFGFAVFDVDDKGRTQWGIKVAPIKSQVARATKV